MLAKNSSENVCLNHLLQIFLTLLTKIKVMIEANSVVLHFLSDNQQKELEIVHVRSMLCTCTIFLIFFLF